MYTSLSRHVRGKVRLELTTIINDAVHQKVKTRGPELHDPSTVVVVSGKGVKRSKRTWPNITFFRRRDKLYGKRRATSFRRSH